MSDIRLLPEQKERVETGIVKFGDDWPGIFIRGDNALYYALCLREAASLMAGVSAMFAADLKELADLLSSCYVRGLAARGVL